MGESSSSAPQPGSRIGVRQPDALVERLIADIRSLGRWPRRRADSSDAAKAEGKLAQRLYHTKMRGRVSAAQLAELATELGDIGVRQPDAVVDRQLAERATELGDIGVRQPDAVVDRLMVDLRSLGRWPRTGSDSTLAERNLRQRLYVAQKGGRVSEAQLAELATELGERPRQHVPLKSIMEDIRAFGRWPQPVRGSSAAAEAERRLAQRLQKAKRVGRVSEAQLAELSSEFADRVDQPAILDEIKPLETLPREVRGSSEVMRATKRARRSEEEQIYGGDLSASVKELQVLGQEHLQQPMPEMLAAVELRR